MDRLKSDFVSNVSHELRTPLTAIKGAVDLVLREVAGPLNEKQTHYLTRVRSNTQHLAGLINDLLDLSKIETGKWSLNRRRVSLGGLVHEVVEALRPVAAEKVDCVRSDRSRTFHPGLGDRDKIKQVLMNLIGNAIKFTPSKAGSEFQRKEIARERVQVSVPTQGPGYRRANKKRFLRSFTRCRRRMEDRNPKGQASVLRSPRHSWNCTVERFGLNPSRVVAARSLLLCRYPRQRMLAPK